MVRIAVCDDTQAHIDRIVTYLGEYRESTSTAFTCEVARFTSGMDLLYACEAGQRFDLLFLDIMMPMVTGIQVAQEIRQRDKVVKIVFLSSSPEFALASYKVKAFSYLLKSCTKDEFFAVFSDVLAEIAVPPAESVMLRGSQGLIKVFLHTIESLEVFDKTLVYCLHNSAKLELAGKLAEHEKPLLAHANFIKPHRSYVINLDYVAAFGKNTVVMLGGNRFPIPKAAFAQVKQVYLDYCCGGA